VNSFENLREQAQKLEADGALYEALECWREAVALKPDGEAYCRLARVAMDLDLNDEAEEALGAALRLDGTIAPAYTVLASLKIRKNDPTAAADLLRRSLMVRESPGAYCLLGSALMDLDETDQAEQSFRKAIALNPRCEDAYYNLGVIYRESEPSKAEELFRRVLEIDSNYADAHRELGWLLLKATDMENAERHLRRAKQLAPENMWGRIYLGNLLWQKGGLEEARQEFTASVLLAPNLAQPRFWLGNLLEAQGDLRGAQELYMEALKIEPDEVDTLARLADVLRRQGDLAGARLRVTRALELDPTHEKSIRILQLIACK
jgi:tetratricopeptide (TPR) repeat protein